MLRTSSRWTALLLVGALAGVIWLGWRCRHDARLRFLPADSAAEWIVYPNAPDILAHPVAEPGREPSTIFRRAVVLESPPANAVMRVRALETFGVQINHQPIPLPSFGAKHTWKEIAELNVRKLLVPGTND